ncbi:MAG: sodium:calcium antiporter [Patescibacteria group bacterium]
MLITYIFSFFALTVVLIKAADLVLESLRSLSRTTGTKAFVLSALILSVATSLPELFVGITSAIEGSSNLSFGNILGANVANISLVAGLSAVFAGSINIQGGILLHEVALAGFAGALPLILAIDGSLGRVDGLILLVVYFAYATSFFKTRFLEIGKHHLSGKSVLRLIKHVSEVEQKAEKSLGHLFIGVVALLFSADLIVKIAKNIASQAGIPIFVIGLILLSVGTTLPELIVSFRTIKGGAPSMFFGNLLGSLIVNSTLILGLVSVIDPIEISGIPAVALPASIFVVLFILFWLFVRTKLRLERWEAGVLLFLYLVFVVATLV